MAKKQPKFSAADVLRQLELEDDDISDKDSVLSDNSETLATWHQTLEDTNNPFESKKTEVLNFDEENRTENITEVLNFDEENRTENLTEVLNFDEENRTENVTEVLNFDEVNGTENVTEVLNFDEENRTENVKEVLNFDEENRTENVTEVLNFDEENRTENVTEVLNFDEENRTENVTEVLNVDEENRTENIIEISLEDIIELSPEKNLDLDNTTGVNKEQGAEEKRTRKRKHEETKKDNWKRNRNRIKRCKGLEYTNNKGIIKGKRKLGNRCNSSFCNKSKNRNCTAITDQMRKDIFTKFWVELQNWDQRKAWVSTLIKKVDIKQKKAGNDSRRNFSWTYNLVHRSKSFQVCKPMFASTLGLSERTLLDWVQESNTSNTQLNESLEIITAEGIAKVQKPTRIASNKSKPDDLDFLNNFLSSLATVESHYCRAAYSDKKFLEPGTTINGIFEEYRRQTKITDVGTLSYPIFHRIFNELRYSVFVPRKDQCDVCVSFKHGNIEQNEYANHVVMMDAARSEKANDTGVAFRDDSVSVWSMDLQAVLLCPRTQASCMYYRTKLKTHNFTLYNMQNHDGYNYLWDEVNGNLSSDVFAWIQYSHFLKFLSANSNVKTLIIWSDECGYQNRNSTLASAYFSLSKITNVTIIQKYLVAGHTQMECDSMHSIIERKLINPIYSPRDYAVIVQCARVNPRPYFVQQLDFSYFQHGFAPISSIRPGRKTGDPTVHCLRAIKYDENSVEYKLSFDESWKQLPQRLPSGAPKLTLLFTKRLPITKRKFEDLQALKIVIPPEIHSFYDNLLKE